MKEVTPRNARDRLSAGISSEAATNLDFMVSSRHQRRSFTTQRQQAKVVSSL